MSGEIDLDPIEDSDGVIEDDVEEVVDYLHAESQGEANPVIFITGDDAQRLRTMCDIVLKEVTTLQQKYDYGCNGYEVIQRDWSSIKESGKKANEATAKLDKLQQDLLAKEKILVGMSSEWEALKPMLSKPSKNLQRGWNVPPELIRLAWNIVFRDSAGFSKKKEELPILKEVITDLNIESLQDQHARDVEKIKQLESTLKSVRAEMALNLLTPSPRVADPETLEMLEAANNEIRDLREDQIRSDEANSDLVGHVMSQKRHIKPLTRDVADLQEKLQKSKQTAESLLAERSDLKAKLTKAIEELTLSKAANNFARSMYENISKNQTELEQEVYALRIFRKGAQRRDQENLEHLRAAGDTISALEESNSEAALLLEAEREKYGDLESLEKDRNRA